VVAAALATAEQQEGPVAPAEQRVGPAVLEPVGEQVPELAVSEPVVGQAPEAEQAEAGRLNQNRLVQRGYGPLESGGQRHRVLCNDARVGFASEMSRNAFLKSAALEPPPA
jgi:hypothetical protein